MKQTITSRLTILNNIFLENGGLEYLQRMIDAVAEDLAEKHEYSSIEYLKHELSDDQNEADHVAFIIYYGVEIL